MKYYIIMASISKKLDANWKLNIFKETFKIIIVKTKGIPLIQN